MQHPGFPGGPPPQYQPGPTQLDFQVRMDLGILQVVWPHVLKQDMKGYISRLPTKQFFVQRLNCGQNAIDLFIQINQNNRSICQLGFTQTFVLLGQLARTTLQIQQEDLLARLLVRHPKINFDISKVTVSAQHKLAQV